jgi:hypothetical protein
VAIATPAPTEISTVSLDRGGAAAREHPKDREDTET